MDGLGYIYADDTNPSWSYPNHKIDTPSTALYKTIQQIYDSDVNKTAWIFMNGYTMELQFSFF
jgi:hypothetical protein